MNEREIIVEALMEILEKKSYSHLVMRGVLDKYDYLEKQQRSFIKRCVEGTIEQKIRLDFCIDQFSKTKCEKMKPFIRTLLRMGAYQILFMDQIPDSAACNECVKLAKKRGFSQLSGFVNGVLRSLSRGKEQIAYPNEEKEPLSYLSVMYSMPQWIVSMWMEMYGREETKQMLKGLLRGRPLTIRLRENLSEEERKTCLSKMKEQGTDYKQHEMLPYAYELTGVDSVARLYGYQEGLFAVQDIGSMLVAELADIGPDMLVVDVCSAPGGKAMHVADKMMGTGQVIARDLTEQKIMLIEENIERLGIKNILPQVWDATCEDEKLVEKADVVIADLPCSGLGVIGRKGDIKYRVTKEDVLQIAKLQKEILQVVSRYVRPGGTLLFSTCTVTKQENEENKEFILANLPFTLQKEKQLLPGIDGSDGFYMVKFIRNQ